MKNLRTIIYRYMKISIIVELINNTKKVNLKIENDIFTIINDEIFAMFRGEKTAEQVAENIQERVQLLVSEGS